MYISICFLALAAIIDLHCFSGETPLAPLFFLLSIFVLAAENIVADAGIWHRQGSIALPILQPFVKEALINDNFVKCRDNL